MTKQELIANYPTWFAAVREQMEWGFSIGPGWLPMFTELCDLIATTQPPADFHFVQIKEKFGLLRVYTRNGNMAIDTLIGYFEDKSGTVCEKCGSAENVETKGKGWIVTLCEKCRNVPQPEANR